MVIGKTNLATRPIVGCCHLTNLTAWFQYQCWKFHNANCNRFIALFVAIITNSVTYATKNNRQGDGDVTKKLSYRKQIARKLRTHYVDGSYGSVTLKWRLRAYRGHGDHWKRHHTWRTDGRQTDTVRQNCYITISRVSTLTDTDTQSPFTDDYYMFGRRPLTRSWVILLTERTNDRMTTTLAYTPPALAE